MPPGEETQDTTGAIPPIEPEAWKIDEFTDPRHAAADLHTKGEQLGQDRFLEVAGVYDGSPQQISQFAKLLGLELWGAIQTPEQLTGALEYAGAEARERLNEILRHNGLMAPKQSEPEQKTFSEQAGKALGNFTEGLKEGTGIGLARRVLGAAGRPIGKAIASEVTRSRNQAGDKYQGEYPGYQPAQVNAIPPPKAPGPGPMFTAKTNHPDADFWIARRGSSKTVGKPHREFAPESIGITVNREHLDPSYAYYLMEHLHQKGHWAERATGTTNLVNINNKHIKELQGMMQPAPQEPGPPVEGPIPPLPKEKPAEQSYGEKEVARIQEATQDPEQFAGEAEEKPGIVMPTGDVDNEDAREGDQLGLFGEGKKKKVPKQYKQENPQGKARVKSLFDKDEDPDQQTLFSSFGEAVSYYSTTR